jgi:cell division protein FtsB
LLVAAGIVLSAYLLVSGGGNLFHSFRLVDDEARLRQEVAELRSREARLTEIRDALRSDEYIEYVAREVLGLVKPGETVVIVQAPPDEASQPDAGDPWWEPLFGR